jgi:regulator of protease activity HflC (stomatin/prohibitin superfamily)
MENKVGFIAGMIKWGLLIIAVLIGLELCTAKISQGNVGVVYNVNGGVEDKVLQQGWHVVAPWEKVTEYPISTEIAYFNGGEHEGRKSDDSIVIGTKDGKAMHVDVQISYHMDASKMAHVFNKFRGQDVNAIEYGYMRQNAQRIANDISSQYTMMDIVGEKKPEFNAKVASALIDFFDDDGIVVEQAGLGKVEPDQATAQAIQNVANAQYAQRQAEYEKQAAMAQAQTVVEKAKGEAEAKKISADAQAYANAKLAQSTDEKVVQLEWVKKWNGILPQYMLGDKTLMQIK